MSIYWWAFAWFIAMVIIITIIKVWKKALYRIKYPALYKRSKRIKKGN